MRRCVTLLAASELPEPDRAKAIAHVARAGRPIPDAAALAQLLANLYPFECAFEAVGKSWQVARAAWHPAEARDFLC